MECVRIRFCFFFINPPFTYLHTNIDRGLYIQHMKYFDIKYFICCFTLPTPSFCLFFSFLPLLSLFPLLERKREGGGRKKKNPKSKVEQVGLQHPQGERTLFSPPSVRIYNPLTPLYRIQIQYIYRDLYFLTYFFFFEKNICKKYNSWPSSSRNVSLFSLFQRGKEREENRGGIYIAFFPLFLSLSIERGERERRGISI